MFVEHFYILWLGIHPCKYISSIFSPRFILYQFKIVVPSMVCVKFLRDTEYFVLSSVTILLLLIKIFIPEKIDKVNRCLILYEKYVIIVSYKYQ